MASSRPPRSRRVAIVTGSGIGKATAVELARQGFDVGVTWHRDRAGAEGTAGEVRAFGRRAESIQFDLAALPDAGDTIDQLADRLGRLDVLVNNAGTIKSSPFLDLSWDDWRSSAYCAAKGGLGMLTKVAAELGGHGITVNAVAPGEITTPMTDQHDVEAKSVHRPGYPLGRPGNAQEVASLIAYLSSPGAGFITGASLVVDGGLELMAAIGAHNLEDDGWRDG